MEENLKKDIEAMVASIFSEKKESEMRKQTEAALQTSATTIEELTTALEAKNTEFTELTQQVSSLEEAQADLTTQLEAAGNEKASVETKLEEAEQKLADIEEEKVAATRMTALTQAGVVRKDADSQTDKVKAMSDEEFASYKEELEAVKASILETMEKAEEEPKEDASDDEPKEDASDEAASDDEPKEDASDDDDDEGVTPPVNINPADTAHAAMNMEVAASDDILAKYAKMGTAMADAFKTKEK